MMFGWIHYDSIHFFVLILGASLSKNDMILENFIQIIPKFL